MSRRRSEHSTTETPSARARAAAPRRRHPRSLLPAKFVEQLEERCLFATIITDTNPLTPTPARQVLQYKDLSGGDVRIVVSGDVSAEFIFARVTKGADKSSVGWNDVILGDHVPAGSKEDGRDLFHVYVAQASLDSYISIARIPNVNANGAHPMQPFAAPATLTANTIRTNNLGRTMAAGTGPIVLGTRTRAIPQVDNSGNRPIRTDNFNGFGIAPATIANRRGRLVAGLSTAQDVNLGKFLFGGAVFGNVVLRGSMETFYCGALLTGVSEGQFTEFGPESPGNFFVQGDIRNILVKGSIGTDGVGGTRLARIQPEYLSGVDFDIRGRVGQIRTNGDYIAWAKVSNTNGGAGMRNRQQEYEFRIDPGPNRGDFTEFENGQLGDNEALFENDTFANPQFLGSFNSKNLGDNVVQLHGNLQSFVNVNDVSDYYAVALMGGQSVSVRLISPIVTGGFVVRNGQLVQVTSEIQSVARVGVFDPDNRLIAADYSNVSATTTQSLDADPVQHQTFNFTADRPGIYRFAVGHDPTFGTTGDRLGLIPYQLQVTGVGNIAIGGLVANETIHNPAQFGFAPIFGDTTTRANIETVLGDLGAIYSIGDHIVSSGLGINALAQGGDLRAFDAESIGGVEGGGTGGATTTRSSGANLMALTGSVGMIRARGTVTGAQILTINEDSQVFAVPAIGGDIQWITTPTTLITDIAANGNIGTVQAGAFGDVFNAGSLSANADGLGRPGTIDLVDVTQSLGTIGTGGPLISPGPGGNVRYIHVTEAAAANVFRPTVFGGGSPEDTTFVQGQEFTYTDDSGANVTITPTQQRFLNPTTGVVTDNSGTLTVLSYPIAPSIANPTFGGGGLAIIRVTTTRGLTISSDGATEIGDIVSTGFGPAFITDPFRPNGPDNIPNNGDENYSLNQTTLPTSSNDIVLGGAGRNGGRRGLVDLFNIRGNNFSLIRNATGGEIVNAQIGQTAEFEATNAGWARSSLRRGMTVEGATVADLAGTAVTDGAQFPYLNTKNAITINGGAEFNPAILDLRVREGLGNLMVNGIAQRITANSDNANVRGVVEGINGAILAIGQFREVNIGEGVAPSGTGNRAQAGIFATAAIPGSNPFTGRVLLVRGTEADIRGDIVSNTGIGSIQLTNGSIINADIMVMRAAQTITGTGADLTPSTEFGGATVTQTTNNGLTGNIRDITLNGDGGIIGTLMLAFNIGPITVNNGFGIINSEMLSVGTGRFSAITADGYGIRGLNVNGGQSLDGLNARAGGKKFATTGFSDGVRFSETEAFDPYFGTRPNALTDLHMVLGTSAAAPISKSGASSGGSIDFTTVAVSRDVGRVEANTVKLSQFNVPNLFGTFTTRDAVDSVNFVIGRADVIAVGKDAVRFRVRAAGDVGVVSIGSSFRGSSNMTVQGKLGSFVTGTSLYGNVYGQRGIDSIRVGTSYGSQGSRTPNNLGAFITNGHVLSGAVLSVEKALTRLVIGGNIQDGAAIKAGTIGTQTIVGTNDGTIDTKPWA